MNKFFVHAICFLIVFNSNCQVAENVFTVKQITGSSQEWIQIPTSPDLNIKTFFEKYKSQVGLPEDSKLELVRVERESNQWNHYRYQQYFNGIKVLGAEYVLHEYNNMLKAANGRIEKSIDINTQSTINSTKAIEIALDIDHSSQYIWELEPNKYPQTELLIIDSQYPNKTGNLLLAYKVDLVSLAPLKEIRYYINAHTGELILSYNILMTCFGSPAAAYTLYAGIRQIETEENNGVYTLHDITRGGGITTQSAAAAGTQYSDADNNWEVGSVAQKVGALDVQFGAESTFDFYKNTFNRDGIDGKNGRILCRVIDTATNYVNAFWESATRTTNFGIGDNKNTGPLTSLDVVGHEMTHGVTENTCGLEYIYEAGALNEALSDIFGKTIEFKNDPAHFNWLVGQKFFFKPDTAFRNMSDPLHYNNPKNYKGKSWVTGSADNGGVHTNSGVLNYWYYLLVSGQSGTNEFGKTFQVQAMGFDATINIVYQMMKNYLTSTANYYDTKEASLHVVENIYGKCSNEYRNVAEAWMAVGIGNGVSEGDLLLVNNKIPQLSCKEGLFPVEVKLVNQSCDQTIPVGTDITMSISVKQKNTIIEIYTLTNDLLPGESVNYRFKEPAKIDKTATLVTVQAVYINDADTTNNRFTISINKNNNSEYDFKVGQVSVSGSPCENNTLQASIQATYSGCDPVPAGTNLDLVLKYDNVIINKKLKTLTTIYSGANYKSAIFTLDRTFSGYKKVLASLNYAPDTTLNNNSTYFNAVYINDSKIGYLEPFDNNQFDSTLMGLRIDSFQTVAIQSNISNSSAIIFSGGSIFDANNKFVPANGSSFANFMSSNPKFTSTIYLCIDTKDLVKAYLSFDYMQKIGSAIYDSLLVNENYAAGTKIVFRNDKGAGIGTTYLEDATREAIMRFFEQEIPLTGGPVSIEITNLSLEGGPDNSGTGVDISKDFVLMDNINIHAVPVSTNNLFSQVLTIYPNPFNESFIVSMKDHQSGTYYKLFNILGSEILQGKINSDVFEINADQLPAGNYILKTYSLSGIIKSYPIIKI